MRQLASPERDRLREDWLVCRECQTLLYRKRFDRLLGVCPNCGRHTPLTADERLAQLLDSASVRPLSPKPTRSDPLSFADRVPYQERLTRARAETGLDDAVRIATGTVAGHPVVVAAMDFRFLGGSLGTAAGEAVTTAAETALAGNLPLLLVTASGGARMQEGTLSLMQMAKTSNALAELDEAGLLTITLITDPTYGGVAASFATLSDIIVAEPGARMGFAGPRVIEQTIRERLPKGFQTAEFLLRHGLVDDVRARAELPTTLGTLLSISRPDALSWGGAEDDPVLRDPERLPARPAGQLLALARHIDRPTMRDHLMYWVSAFLELHGDRAGADCPAIIGGLAIVSGLPMVLIGHQKGHTTNELVERNFGMPSPAGYRKAVRLMRLAAKLRIPLVTLIDTPGAYPGREAEEQGQAHVIAECLRTMGGLRVPVVNVITGEGGSGGALALGVGDRLLMCQNATYSVISPEGCAAILWKTPAEAPAAAAALRIDAKSLLDIRVVDGVIPEPDGGAHRDPATASSLIRRAVVCALRELSGMAGHELVRTRRARFRGFGALDVAIRTQEASR